MKTRTAVAAALVVALAAIVAATAWPAGGATRAHVQRVTITILPSSASHTDAVAIPPNVAIAPGVAVSVTLVNYTRDFHTFTIPGLHVSAMAVPATAKGPGKTTITFRALKWGTFAWYCVICQRGMHGPAHHMTGRIYVITDPRAVP